MRIVLEGGELENFDFVKAAEIWSEMRNRRRYCLVETVFNGNLARASCTKVLNHINPVSTHLHKPAC